jgi:hypothetical protein
MHAWIVVKVALDRYLHRGKFGVIRIQDRIPLLRDKRGGEVEDK